MFHELTPSFPTFESYVSAYGCGREPVILRTRRDHDFSINGKSGVLPAGTKVIGFEWKSGAYRIPCIGFVHSTHIDLEN